MKNLELADSKPIPYESTRRVLIPGIAAVLAVWLVQPGLGLLMNWAHPGGTITPPGIFRVKIPFTEPIFIHFVHWDLIVGFAVAGAFSALYGAFVASSLKQRSLAALFPSFFEILKWLWMLRFPLPPSIDPARQVYRFMTLSVSVNISFWLMHIVIPTLAAMAFLSIFNRRIRGQSLKSVD
jgi:hypothetical protein